MKANTFKNGIHPPEHKELSEHKPIVQLMPATNMVVVPVTQGGAPNTPLVKVGDTVVRGQKIAETDAFMSAPVHAPLSGTVKKIETRLVTGSAEVPCIVIEADGSDTTDFMPALDPYACSKEDALARVKQAGIVGMGGAAFPTHVKLNPPPGKVIDYFLANGAECEPYLTIDDRTMAENADRFIDGLAIAAHIVSAKEVIVAVEDNKKHLYPILEAAIEKINKEANANIRLQPVKTKYPQGGEKMLVKAVTGREIPSGGLPADAGCIIQNVGSLVAISEAFREGKPLIDRPLTISGGACENPQNICVPIGTLIGDLIPEHITLKPGIVKILAGGPMMGISMPTANFPVQKNTSGVLFLTEKETVLEETYACIGCSRCVKACPCFLTPVMIVRSLKANKLDDAMRYGLMDCIECGSCAYVCPGRVKLVQHFRVGKQLWREELTRRKLHEEADAGGKK